MQLETAERLLEQRLQQRDRELTAVVNMTHALQNRLDLSELMSQAVLAAMSTVNADAGSLLLHDATRHTLVFRHAEGPTRDRVIGLEFEDTRGIAGDVFHSGKARISPDVTSDRTHILDIDQAASYETLNMITVPLRAGTDETIGVLQILNKRDGFFTENDLAVVEILATQVAAAIITGQLHERAQAAAIVDLLGQISHDIKNLMTPVSVAGYTLRMMLEEFHEKMQSLLTVHDLPAAELALAVDEKVQSICRDADEVFDILDQSTTIARERTKELADAVKGLTSPALFELASIDDTVRGVCRVLHGIAIQRGIDLRMELAESPPIYHDPRRLYNALYNLVNNALDSTPDGGHVTIATSFTSDGHFPDGYYLQIAVADTGCGMTQAMTQKLFSGHMCSTKAGGTGLGTRVVKNVVEAHCGRILVDSIEGKGTTVRMRLPMKTATEMVTG